LGGPRSRSHIDRARQRQHGLVRAMEQRHIAAGPIRLVSRSTRLKIVASTSPFLPLPTLVVAPDVPQPLSQAKEESPGIACASAVGVKLHMHRDIGVCSSDTTS
jgi:hypothetical protein